MKIYCNVYDKFRQSEKNEILFLFKKKPLSLFIVYSRWSHEYEKIFKEEESIKILKILGLTTDKKEY